MCQIRVHHPCRSLGPGSPARINVSQAVVDVGIPSLTDAEQERIARFGRSSHAIGQPFSLVGGQTAEARIPES